MISRSTLFSSAGGDTIQLLNTAKYLRYLDISVDIKLTTDSIDYTQYDLIHFFNIIRPADILPHIYKAKLPFVVSTIYVDYSNYERKNRNGILGVAFKFLKPDQIEFMKFFARYFFNKEGVLQNDYIRLGHRKSIQKIAGGAKLLLPNSQSEYNRFSRDYAVNAPFAVIPNAVDTSLFADSITADTNYKDHVISVARIEGRKNQLNLVKAALQTDLKLSVIGKASPNHVSYYESCLHVAARSSRIQFISHLQQSELAPIYKAAKVHVLASWFETTGLSTLEAALLGCNIVITDKGDTRDYFKDYAFYCDPDNIASIKNAIQDAYTSPFPDELRRLILDNYTWEIAAEKTLQAYEHALLNTVTIT